MRPPLRSNTATVLAALVLHLAAAITLDAQTHADPAAVVRELFVRYAAGDLRGATDLWVAGAPAEDFVRRHRARLAKRCIRLETLTIDAVSEDPAVFDAAATISLRAASPDSPEWWESSRSRFTLKREGGEWRIAAWEPRERELIDRLVLAANDAERSSILDASELQTTTFVRLASRRAIDFVNQGRRDEAGILSAVAVQVAERLGDPVSMAAGLAARSVALRARSDIDASLTAAEQAVALADGSGDPDVLAGALVRLTRTLEYRKGIPDPELVERVLGFSAEVEDAAIVAHAAVHLGRAHELRGRYREAFRLAELASRFAEESGDRAALMSASMLLQGAFLWTGDTELAMRHASRVSELAREGGFEIGSASGTTMLASAAAMRGDSTLGLRMLDDSLRKTQDPGTMASLLLARTGILRDMGRLDEAERDLIQIEAIGPTEPSSAQEIRLARGLLAWSRRDEKAALAHLAAIRGPNNWLNFAARLYSADILLDLGRIDDASSQLEEVLPKGETPAIDPRRSLFHDERRTEQPILIELLVAQGNSMAALRAADAMKSKQLREALAHRGAIPAADAHPREQAIQAQIRDLNRRLVSGKISGPPAAAIREQLAAARVDLLDLSQRLYVEGPATSPPPSGELCVEDLPAHLDDVTIVSYVVGGRRTLILVLEPKRDGQRQVTVRTIEMTRWVLFSKIARLVTLVEQRNLRAPAAAAEIYDLLIAPIESSVRTARSFCIIPDMDLWQVPFQALGPEGGPLLVDRVPLFYAPSITVLASVRPTGARPRADKPRLLAFANPTVGAKTASLYRAFDPDAPLGAIPETEREVRAIARIYGDDASRVYVGKTALETTLKEEASQFDVLHIATHGIVYEKAPMFSSLLLTTSPGDESEDGVLEAREIAALALDTDLTVLSACETGRATTSGSGVIGLSWAFLAAGCPTTVVSQWKAHSAASAILMVEFHRQLAAGFSKPEALRRAQLALRGDRRYRHPFYWAPFMVIGMP